MLTYRIYEKQMLYYDIVSKGPIPTLYDPDGIYPYESYVETVKRPKHKDYEMIEIENNFIKAVFCPDLGGKLFSLRLKSGDKEVLYDSMAVKPVRILPRMAFISGGIEVSFPISHTPSQIEKVCYKVEKMEDRLYVWMGETEICNGMQWTFEFSLGEDDEFLTQRAVFNNPTGKVHPYMSWSNAAVPARADSIISYPNGRVLSHSKEMSELDWSGDKKVSDFNQMHGFFWKTTDCNAFGVFTPTLGTGLYHIADKEEASGMKLWLYGIGEEERWAYQTSMKKESYIEIQASSIKEQADKKELKPGESTSRTEFWIPSDQHRDIHSLQLPKVNLIPIDTVPLFQVADREKNIAWKEVCYAYETKQAIDPKIIGYCNWPPCGISGLKEALRYFSTMDSNSIWKYYYALYLLAEDNSNYEKALALLTESDTPAAYALLGRMFRLKKQYEQSLQAFEKINDPVWSNHPQIVYERDLTLENLKDKIDLRVKYLNAIDETEDDFIVERRVKCLMDCGEYKMAKELLLSHKFELVHQRYDRTKMLKEILDNLGEKHKLGVPQNIGEDELATYGAYRVNE
jgi:tetratricopeptide (TPR) repeat protein